MANFSKRPLADIEKAEHQDSLDSKRVTPVASKNSSYPIEIGKGNITGYDWEFLTGDNTAVGTSETILRSIGGTGDYPFPATATQWFVQSTDAADTSAGTGAQTVVLILLEDETDRSISNEVIEVVTLNGTTSVQIATTAFRVNTFAVASAGSSFQNAGTITLTTLTGGAGDILGGISAAEGQMRQPVRTVPNGETWFPMNFYPSSGKADDVDVRAIAFTPFPIPGRVRTMFSKNFVFEGTFPFVNDTRIQFPQAFDLEVLAQKSTGASSGRVGIILEFQTVVNDEF